MGGDDSDQDDQELEIQRVEPRRSIRATAGVRSDVKAGKSALERLKAVRAEGRKNKELHIEEKPLYDLVSEQEYSKIVERRQQDDWVVDDGLVDGYADDGREVFEDDLEAEREDRRRKVKGRGQSDSNGTTTTSDKKNPNIVRPSEVPGTGSIKAFFQRSTVSGSSTSNSSFGAASAPKKKRTEDGHTDAADDDDPLADILSELRKPTSAIKPAPRPSPLVTTPVAPTSRPRPSWSDVAVPKLAELPPPPPSYFDEPAPPLFDEQPVEPEPSPMPVASTSVGPKVKVEAKVEPKVLDDDEFILKYASKAIDDNEMEVSSSEEKPSVTAAAPGSPSASASLPFIDVETEQGQTKVLRFYWYDACEDPTKQYGSNIFLFGKVHQPELGRYASCCIVIYNIERRVYVLPREGSKFAECHAEFTSLLAKRRIMRERCAQRELGHVTAFSDSAIPAQAKYMEVRYPAEYGPLPSDLSGHHFSHVFGTSATPLEVLLVSKQMKGPCWLDISNVDPSSSKVSWCKLEGRINDAKCIQVFTPAADQAMPRPPDFTIMSLHIQLAAVGNPAKTGGLRQSAAEIVAVTALIHPTYRFDRPSPNPAFKQHFTLLTRPSDAIMPLDFKDEVKKRIGSKFQVEVMPNERALLSYLLQKIFNSAPDVIIGHDMTGFQLDSLLQRLVHLKVLGWSKLGGLNRGNATLPSGKLSMQLRQQITAGRLVCDTLLMAKELVHQRSYDLSELVSSMFKKQRVAYEAEQVSRAYNSSAQLIDFVKATIDDCNYVLQLAYELNVLPLANQLSSICGCLLGRTLAGGRSERNEWLLLHAFAERNYIPPERQNPFQTGKPGDAGKRGNVKQEPVDDGGQSDEEEDLMGGGKKGGKSKHKAAYSGGLVLEPKKGFYDKFVLLLDFNSLYPSIIQEFNICFTTVTKQTSSSDGGNSIAAVSATQEGENAALQELDELAALVLPNTTVAPGVLPSVLKRIVDSRREVKKLMASPGLTPDQMIQYDIRQRALKLTANSMYGCLGFSRSRFYARPLASLITSKGREILAATRDLVMKKNSNLDVIYGDTDSVMIYTNCNDYDEVLAIGQRIKVEVNKHYRLLEIEVDGVFKTMLLLKKKKYAALTIVKKNSDGSLTTKSELKGLDIVRRDWCQLAREVGTYAVDKILLSESMESVVDTVSTKLTEVAKRIAEGSYDVSQFVISRQLARDPTEYADMKSLPHVQVAARLNKAAAGRKFRAGDTIFYVICEDGTSNGHMQRAYHPDELAKSQADFSSAATEAKAAVQLKIDSKYYLAQQIHPVVSRLCIPIPGLDAVRIAELLNLDTSPYRRVIAGGSSSSDAENLLSHFAANVNAMLTSNPDSTRFASCEKFHFVCPKCRQEVRIDRPFVFDDTSTANSKGRFTLEACQNCRESVPDDFLRGNDLEFELRKQITEHINRFYASGYTCEDPACGYRTCRLPFRLQNGQALCPACEKVPLLPEASHRQLYEQLLAYKLTFDLNTVKNVVPADKPLNDSVIYCYNRLGGLVQTYLMSSAYAVVDLGSIFTLCCPSSRQAKN